MIKITKENIIPYLKEHLPDFDDSLPVNISMVEREQRKRTETAM